ncbi:hypothetical protein ACOYR1_18065 [Thalassotalea piscium]
MSPQVDFGESFKANVDWHKPQANPKNNQEYFIASKQGQLHLLDSNKIINPPILNIKQFYPEFITLNSLVLHPNFGLIQQKGYNTFYTAHVEPTDKTKRTLRVKDNTISRVFPYEVTIVEWKIKEINSLKVDPESRREIFRIGVNQPEKAVIGMRFNPYIKSWHDNFSHLYIALAYDVTLKESSLYSGAILRINPEKFGLRSYTTPNNNPFINQPEIPDELLIIGAQQIKQFLWQKNNDQQLIVSHVYDHQPLLSQLDYGDNLLASAPKTTLLKGDVISAKDTLVLYRGRAFKELRNKLLYLTKKEGSWQLQSLTTTLPFQKNIIHAFSKNELASEDQPAFFEDNNDEVMLFSRAQHVIQRLDKKASNGLSDQTVLSSDNQEQNDEASYGYLIGLLILFGGGLAWFVKNKKAQQAVKSLLHRNYARFELSPDQTQVFLFQRHQEDSSLTLDVNTIVRCDIVLNNEKLLSIKAGVSGFDEALEQMLENQFIAEKRIKMVDQRTRKLELIIGDNTDMEYGICLYFREGNQRLTKAKFGTITDELKDWCWFIANKISPEQTGKRIVKTVQPQPVRVPSTPRQVVTKPIPKAEEVKSTPTPQTVKKRGDESESNRNSSELDTQLIDALNKLANLKAEGFLTEDEFVNAKTKILANLKDNESRG